MRYDMNSNDNPLINQTTAPQRGDITDQMFSLNSPHMYCRTKGISDYTPTLYFNSPISVLIKYCSMIIHSSPFLVFPYARKFHLSINV